MASTDRDALVALYNATDGANWETKTNWNTGADLSQWYGIEVNDRGRVVALRLGANNLRGTIPRELGKLTALTWLDLSSNGLTGPIPKELGALSELRRLWLRNNNLTGSIPKELGGLSKLKELSLSSNWLTVFPRAAAEKLAFTGARVSTVDNPWKEPPADVMTMGMAHVAEFLRDLDDYGRASSNRLKIVLVGLGEAGKTSIATRLEGRFGSSCPKPEDRTVGVEIRDVRLGPGPTSEGNGSNNELEVSLWDFAGQRAYYDTHQMFLTPDALFILVVDMFAYVEEHSREDALDLWLDILQSRVPGSVVLLVGTHIDSFGGDSAKCNERLRRFEEDVDDTIKRIRSECASSKEDAENELGNEHPGLEGNHLYQPLRVVKERELLTLNLTSSDGRDIYRIQNTIERLAYYGHDGYSFASVASVIPETYLPAVATLEAVRRGADLSGSGGIRADVAQRLREGDPRKGRPFIRFSDALSLFMGMEKKSLTSVLSSFFLQKAKEKERVFLAAIKSHEAHGAILLTRVDGGGGGQQQPQTGTGATASEENLIIHVNPAWFADLVRRVVDVRLVDPQQRAKVVEAMEASKSVRSAGMVLTLTDQHDDFCKAGRVSKDYLKFLWLRDMKLGETSQEAPPLKMSEEDINIVVDSLLDVRFMFRVRDGDDTFAPDLYVVASCLPNKAEPEVEPRETLELTTGGAIFSQKLKLVGAHAVPPGLVPRLLAWCGRGQGRIKVCWKRGVCFAFNNHLVLLYELRTAGGASWIECHAKGSPHDESARRVLKEVGDQVDQLLNDKSYGFPGLALSHSGEPVETTVCSDDHEPLVARIVSVLGDQMNVKADELSRKREILWGGLKGELFETLDQKLNSVLSTILERSKSQSLKIDEALVGRLGTLRSDVHSDVESQLDALEPNLLESVEKVVREKLSTTTAAGGSCVLSEKDRGILNSLARNVAFMRWPIPRLVCMLPAPGRREKHLDENDRSFQVWSLALKGWCSDGKKKGRGVATRKLHLFFLCAQDGSLAECGPDGQGYEVKELLDWVKRVKPFAKVGLALASIALQVCTSLALPTDAFEAALGIKAGVALSTHVEGALTSRFEAMASVACERLERDRSAERLQQAGAHQEGIQKVSPVEGFAYEELRDTIKAFEVKGMGGRSPFPRFDTTMTLEAKGRRGVEWEWVRTSNAHKFVRPSV